MLHVASTIIELVGNLLEPAAYLVGVIGNAEGARKMLRRKRNPAPTIDAETVQVRIGIVGPGHVPAYRLEAVSSVGDGSDDEVIGTFDGEKHVPLGTLNDPEGPVRWSDAATPVADVKKALTIVRRFGSAGLR